MFWRKILFLAAWYAAWNIIGNLYSNKNTRNNKDNTNTNSKKILDDFVVTHKNFLEDIESNYIPADKKDMYFKKKQEFLSEAEKYIQQWEELFQNVSSSEKFQSWKNKARWFASHISKSQDSIDPIEESLK